MNILIINHERNMGGASKCLVTMAKELQERGHHVVVILPIKQGQVYQALCEAGIKTYIVFFGWWMMPSYWNPMMKAAFRVLYALKGPAVARIARIAGDEHIDIIHTNSSAIDVGALSAKKAHIPHVWHFREFGDADYRLEYLKGREQSCAFVRECGGKVIFISQNLRNYYKSEISDEQCEVIYDGIPGEYLRPKERGVIECEKPTIFLIAGNLQRSKGQDIALSACKILEGRGYENFELWIAGAAAAVEDSRIYERELKEYADANLKKDRVKFLGFVSDMIALRAQTDVELVCSTREAFGLVSVEAMMSSNPVIAANSGASPEIIVDGWSAKDGDASGDEADATVAATGLLFQTGSPSDLADKMQYLLDHPGQITAYGRNAYTYAKETFTSARNTEAVERIYLSEAHR